MDRRSSCCSGRSYAPPTVTTPKKEPTVSPVEESDVKPVTVDLKKEAKEISSSGLKDNQGLPEPAPVKTEEKVNVNVGYGGGGCGF